MYTIASFIFSKAITVMLNLTSIGQNQPTEPDHPAYRPPCVWKFGSGEQLQLTLSSLPLNGSSKLCRPDDRALHAEAQARSGMEPNLAHGAVTMGLICCTRPGPSIRLALCTRWDPQTGTVP